MLSTDDMADLRLKRKAKRNNQKPINNNVTKDLEKFPVQSAQILKAYGYFDYV